MLVSLKPPTTAVYWSKSLTFINLINLERIELLVEYLPITCFLWMSSLVLVAQFLYKVFCLTDEGWWKPICKSFESFFESCIVVKNNGRCFPNACYFVRWQWWYGSFVYGQELIFFTAFVSIQGLYPRVPAHHFCVKSGVLVSVSQEQNQVSRDDHPSSTKPKQW